MEQKGERQHRPGHTAVEPTTIRSRDDFARALADARARSGLSVRKLGKLLDIPPTTIHGWFTGRHLPYPRDDATFRRVLATIGVDDTEPWWIALDRLRRGRPPMESPYRGLASYDRDHEDVFFGRTSLSERAVDVISNARAADADGLPRLVFLVGASGSGKSSLLHAGVQPRLERLGHHIAAFRPGALPLAMWGQLDTATDTLLIDQFEELFTQTAEPERREFIELMSTWALTPGRVAVGAVRADYFAELAASPLASGLAHQVFVGPMTWPELEECIVGPARARGMVVGDDLLAALRRDFVPEREHGATHARGALPLLSHILWRITDGSEHDHLTTADYFRSGGLDGTVEQASEEAYATLDEESKAAWRRFVPLLVNVDSGGTVTRRLVHPEQTASLVATEEGLDAALAAFVDARLVTISGDGAELTHEALLSSWPRLREWIEEDRSVLSSRGELTEATRVWLEHRRHPSALVTGVRLARLQPWTDPAYRLLLSADEADFVRCSNAHERDLERRDRRRRRNLRWLSAVATTLSLVTGGLAIATSRSAAEARRSRDAELSRQIALRSDGVRDVDPLLAGQLALAAYRVSPTEEARSSLAEAATAPRSSRLLGGPGSTALAASPDGHLLAFGSEADSLIQLVSRSDGRLARRGVIQLGAGVATYAMAFSPDGTVLAVGTTGGGVTSWDVTDPAAPRAVGTAIAGLSGAVFGMAPLEGGWAIAAGGEPVRLTVGGAERRLTASDARAVAVAPDGWLATGTADGSVSIWDRAGRPVSEPGRQLGSEVTSLAVSPDGTLLVAGTKSRDVLVWDVADPGEPRAIESVPTDFSSWVNDVAFSPDGTLLAAGSSDRTVRVWSTGDWSIAGGYELPDAVTGVEFLRDGSLATTSVDGSLRVWDTNDRSDPILGSNIWTGGYSGDGTRFAAFGDTAAVWDTSEPGHPRPLASDIAPDEGWAMSGAGAISPDGKTLALGGADGEFALVDIAEPEAARQVGGTVRDATGLIEYLRFLRDGKVLAVGGDDGAIRFYDVTRAERPELLGQPYTIDGAIVFAFATDPDERVLAVTGSDDSVHLVDISDITAPTELGVLGGFEADTTGVAISPDGNTLVAASNDEYILFWDISDPAAPTRVGEPLEGPHATPFTLDWSADGRFLAASATDHSVWVWNVSDPRHPDLYVHLESPGGPMHVASISPDAATVAGAGADTTVYFWPLDPQAAASELCAVAGDQISADEWDTYFRGRAYDNPCDG